MYPIATRLFLIAALLVSLQTSAGMLMGLDSAKPLAKVHCADMQDMEMEMVDTSSAKKDGKTQCDVSCCMSFVTASVSTLIITIKPKTDFENIPAQSPSRFSHLNYRPPILS